MGDPGLGFGGGVAAVRTLSNASGDIGTQESGALRERQEEQ